MFFLMMFHFLTPSPSLTIWLKKDLFIHLLSNSDRNLPHLNINLHVLHCDTHQLGLDVEHSCGGQWCNFKQEVLLLTFRQVFHLQQDTFFHEFGSSVPQCLLAAALASMQGLMHISRREQLMF